MKRVLIISPYFPPTNAADMQRIRMSLPYFKEFGWDAEVVTVDEQYSDLPKDELLKESLPVDLKVHKVKALSKNATSKFGLGSLALRSLWFFRQKVNKLLSKERFDLIYFSTTQFPVCILGRYWKKRFGVPYVIDMQDPWHSEYYQDKPQHQRPPKYWFSYRLNKYLEPMAMKAVDGLISVSEKYILDLQERYPRLKKVPNEVITFSAYEPDMKIAIDNESKFEKILDPAYKNVVYIGRGGADMHAAIKPIFYALSQFVKSEANQGQKIKFYFIGTSYASPGAGICTIKPIASQFGLQSYVIEITNRISYYNTLTILKKADALFIPGSDDNKYTASKLYPYLFIKKPIVAIFNSQSPALDVLTSVGVKDAYSYNGTIDLHDKLLTFLKLLLNNKLPAPEYNDEKLQQFSAIYTTKKQCHLFNQVIK